MPGHIAAEITQILQRVHPAKNAIFIKYAFHTCLAFEVIWKKLEFMPFLLETL
jgi:hypothetical protein